MTVRTCGYCGAPLEPSRRSDAEYCSDSHRTLARKRRLRDERDKAKAAALGVSLKRYREVMKRESTPPNAKAKAKQMASSPEERLAQMPPGRLATPEDMARHFGPRSVLFGSPIQPELELDETTDDTNGEETDR